MKGATTDGEDRLGLNGSGMGELADDLEATLDRQGRFVAFNGAWERTLGWSPLDLRGRRAFDLIHPDDLERTRAIVSTPLADPPQVVNFANRYRTRDGAWRWLLWTGRASATHWHASAKDITDVMTLGQLALHDPLTGLPNRALIMDRLGLALARLRRRPGRVALLFVDIDRFKAVNDGLGHRAGDALLAVAARRLTSAMRGSDTVARLGGDEFVLLAEDVNDEADACGLANRVLDAFDAPFELIDGTVRAEVSVGVATTTHPDAGVEDLLREADVAMYRAKARPGSNYALFDEAVRREVAQRVEDEIELRRALIDDQLRLVFQPVVEVGGGSVVACEALVRWRRTDGRLAAPAEFLPLAEENGLIVQIGAWVLEHACRQAREWRRAGRNLTVAINVSQRQLDDPGFGDLVAATLKAAGLPAPAVCLEITETAVTSRPAEAAHNLTRLRRLGVRIAIDDFGRGFSSLSHLKTLPVDVIKLDRSFVQDLARTGSEDRSIVAAVLAMAEELGMTVIAEGVETDAQVAVLRELRCPHAQGYWYSIPKPAGDLVLDSFGGSLSPGVGDPFVIREFMRQIGIPARIQP